MTGATITKQQRDATHGRYVARLAGNPDEAEITFTLRSPGVISADHTGVPDSMGGHGIAKALLAFMLEDARRNGFRIVPLCSFISGQYAKHPEWADLFTTAPGERPKL